MCVDSDRQADIVCKCVCVCVPELRVDPGVIHRWGQRDGDGGGADVADDAEGLLKGMVHPQDLLSVLRLISTLLHQHALIRARVQECQQLRVDELLRLEWMGG